MSASFYRTRARRSLSGNWLLSALTVFIASLLGGTLISSGSNVRIDQDTLNLLRSAPEEYCRF